MKKAKMIDAAAVVAVLVVAVLSGCASLNMRHSGYAMSPEVVDRDNDAQELLNRQREYLSQYEQGKITLADWKIYLEQEEWLLGVLGGFANKFHPVLKRIV